jgi:hypothetical protein
MPHPDVVIVSGSRDWKPEQCPVHEVLSCYSPGTWLIHGRCPTGLDEIADVYGRARGFVVLGMPYFESEVDGKEARNASMVAVGVALKNVGHIVECHAFPLAQSRGTWKFYEMSRAAGLLTHLHNAYGR